MADSENDVKDPSHFTYIWAIENMCSYCYLISPTFTVKEMEMTKWSICLDVDNLEFVDIGIQREEEDDGPNSIEIKFELSFMGINGLPLMQEVGVCNFEKGYKFWFSEFADKAKVCFQRRAEFLPKDILTLRCRMWRIGTGISHLDSCFARTRLRFARRSFIWAIKEFSTLQKNQERKFVLGTASTNQIIFNLFVTENGSEEYINISAQGSGDEFFECFCIKICLLDFEGRVVHFEEDSGLFYEFDFLNFFRKGRLVDDKESLLPNDVLILRCEVERKAKIVWNVIESYRYLNSMSSCVTATDAGEILYGEHDDTLNVSCSLTETMKSLIEEGTLSDVNLRTDSKSFPAHKCILSARSPVFKAMFSGDMKEKTGKSVEIPDLDEDTLREMLSYIYTDTVGELQWRGTADLYRAADKYELLDLKRRCATFLKSNLSVSNVCAVLSVADMHHDRELRKTAENFIMRQDAEFFKSDTWHRFKDENSKMYLEILERIVCNMKGHR